MRLSCRLRVPLRTIANRLGLIRLKRDEEGATAIEFAMVAVPFFMFIFGLIGIALYFFVMSSLDWGMDKQSRLIRTGQTQNMTYGDFKNGLCTIASGGVSSASGNTPWIKCDKLQLFVQKFPDWQSVKTQSCLNSNGTVAVNNANSNDLIAAYSGTASDIVIVTTCYKWDFAKNLPFVKIGNMSDGSMMMQTSTAFRSEPYTPN